MSRFLFVPSESNFDHDKRAPGVTRYAQISYQHQTRFGVLLTWVIIQDRGQSRMLTPYAPFVDQLE
jgi:hypothetical protein